MVGVVEKAVMQDVGESMAESVVAAVQAPKSAGRVKRLERPDQKELDEKLGNFAKEESKCLQRIEEIKALIEGKNATRQESSAEVQAAKDRFQQALILMRAALEEKKAIREELAMADNARNSAKEEAKALKEKLPFVKVEQIDEEIKRLEYRMTHTTLPLPEEKKILAQVRELTKSRDFVAKYTERLQKLTSDETARTEIASRLKLKELVINDLEKQVAAAKLEVNTLRDSRAAEGEGTQALFDEKRLNHEKINEIRAAVKQTRVEFKARLDEFYEREREWRAQQQVERKRQYELREAERQERDRRRREWEKENFVEPFTDEILQCDQLIIFCQKAAPSEASTTSAIASKADLIAPEGSAILVSKKNRKEEELDGWFGGLSQGKNRKKGKVPVTEKKGKADKLVLTLDAISSFGKVKVTAPTTKEDASKTIELLKEKKKEFIQLQTEAREKREAAEKEAEASVVEAAEVSPSAAADTEAEEDGVIVEAETVETETTAPIEKEAVEAVEESKIESQSEVESDKAAE
eukprot:TRINITY_DN21600_c0_g1_i1.p1 TRINITY_DN21600_c0_g1~~TRINITY_DN21600_c0_g1_i1.p1  ORF type:complete len:525 (-),score=148.58 TRINITY_DN21600_c0_g1_i1:885-2459(-)